MAKATGQSAKTDDPSDLAFSSMADLQRHYMPGRADTAVLRGEDAEEVGRLIAEQTLAAISLPSA